MLINWETGSYQTFYSYCDNDKFQRAFLSFKQNTAYLNIKFNLLNSEGANGT